MKTATATATATLLSCLVLAGCPTPADDGGDELGETGSATTETGDGDTTDTTGDTTTSDTTGDTTTSDTTGDTTTGDCGPDMPDDIYLLALMTSLGPNTPLQFVLTVDWMFAADCASVATFSFQPLSLDVGSTTTPREFVGDPLVFPDIGFDAMGNFEIDMGVVMVTGIANPITGSDITASLLVSGHVVHVDALCGDITGMLMSPLQYDLAGSTFAAIRLADDGSDPATLPVMFPSDCSQVPPL